MNHSAKILIVDDSRIFRAAIEAALAGQPGLTVAGSVFSGQKAIELIRAQPVDIVTLDVEMPGMNGLQTLQEIQQVNRSRLPGAEIGVLMVSAFTKRGADVTMQALQAGAFDFVTKPSGVSGEESLELLRQDLIPKVRMFLARRSRTSGGTSPPTSAIPPRIAIAAKTPSSHAVGPQRSVRAVVIGASTGGPKALATILSGVVAAVDAPIIVVQHMPAEFTKSLADNLARLTQCVIVEAEEGQLLGPKSVYIARGGKHLVVRRDPQGRLVAGLNDQPPECGCRPSASVLFRSAAATVGGELVAIVLTGMGNDGTAGLGSIKRAGGYVIAQDEPSSVVWGMPGSAVAAGVVDVVAPLAEIAAAVAAVTIRRGPR